MNYGIQETTFNYDQLIVWFQPLLLGLGLALAIVVVLFLALLMAKKIIAGRKLPVAYQKKIFRLLVPAPSSDRENNHRPLKEILGRLENFYANLGGLRAERGWKSWLWGRHDEWSFEIVMEKDGLISFYMAVPEYLADHLKQQLLSHYPHCQIEEVEDYNIFGSQGYVAAGYLKLAKGLMFPILTYEEMESDPLEALLSALAKLEQGQTAAVQFMLRSAKADWRRAGVKIASEMQQGKSLKQAMSSSGSSGWLSLLGKPADWFYSGSSQTKDLNRPPELYRLSPMEEQMVKLLEKKASKAGLDVNVRVIAFAPLENRAKDILRQVADSFGQYSSYQYANAFKAVIKKQVGQLVNDFIYRRFNEDIRLVLNTEEMTSLWHLPVAEANIPNLRWLTAKQLPPPINMPTEGLLLGESFYRDHQIEVKIKEADRRRHMYIVGMTGTGKSWTLANLAIQDIKAGHGVCLVDPHGTLIEEILPYIPPERFEDVIIFDPSDTERPIGLNMLEAKTPQEMDFAAQEMITIFYKLLPDPAMAGPMFEHYMRNALLALMADRDNPGTLVELARIFTDEAFRREKLQHVTDILVKDFWEREYTASQKGSTGADMLSYVISKTGRFVENEMMRNIIGQPRSGVNFRQVMDRGQILLLNLSKGKVGETNSSLLGLIAVSKLQMAALARADMPENKRRDFYLYIDEFQNFITDSIAIILAEARKYKLNLILSHQYIAQLTQGGDHKVRDAVFGNVGTIICCRIGVDDVEVLAKQLGPKVSEYDLMNVEKFDAYARLLIDNTASEAFNLHRFPLPADGNQEIVSSLKGLSRLKYGREKSLVVREIIERSKIGQLGQPPLAKAGPTGKSL